MKSLNVYSILWNKMCLISYNGSTAFRMKGCNTGEDPVPRVGSWERETSTSRDPLGWAVAAGPYFWWVFHLGEFVILLRKIFILVIFSLKSTGQASYWWFPKMKSSWTHILSASQLTLMPINDTARYNCCCWRTDPPNDLTREIYHTRCFYYLGCFEF